jgi:hypothetical protein
MDIISFVRLVFHDFCLLLLLLLLLILLLFIFSSPPPPPLLLLLLLLLLYLFFFFFSICTDYFEITEFSGCVEAAVTSHLWAGIFLT